MHRTFKFVTYICAMFALSSVHTKAYIQDACPIGFNIIYTKSYEPFCYRIKGPEKFEDKFIDCVGNKFSLGLLQDLVFDVKINQQFWGDLKTLYPGGPFVDLSLTNSTGSTSLGSFGKSQKSQSYHQDLCTVWTLYDNNYEYLHSSCNEIHHRLCIVDVYEDSLDDEGCDADYVRFNSPRSTCLLKIDGAGGGTVRATWIQAQNMCNARNGSLLHRGWIYSNHPDLKDTLGNWRLPLGTFLAENSKLFWCEPEDNIAEVKDNERTIGKIGHKEFTVGISLVALINDTWHFVNNSSVFYNVVCEKAVDAPKVSFNVTRYKFGELALRVSSDTNDFNVNPICLTDSDVLLTNNSAKMFSGDIRVNITKTQEQNREFILMPKSDGYYWCINAGSNNHEILESNKYLYIAERESLRHLYSIKIKRKHSYSMNRLDAVLESLLKKLSELIFLNTQYLKVYGSFNVSKSDEIEDILKNFKAEKVGVYNENEIIRRGKLKRIYLDRKTALIHVEISPNMIPLIPGYWDELQVIYMRPVYFCRALESVPSLHLGESMAAYDCKTYTCVGDFNEGVQLVETQTPSCITASNDRLVTVTLPVNLATAPTTRSIDTTTELWTTQPPVTEQPLADSSEEICQSTTETTTYFTTEGAVLSRQMTDSTIGTVTTVTMPTPGTTTTFRPPPSPIPPEQQVKDVLDHLETLLQSDVIQVNDIKNAFDEVEELLSIEDDFEIPGNFLTMMDELGVRADLNGSRQVATVRSHIALVVTDADSLNPVRGLRIATRANEEFQADAFHVLADTNNQTYLEMDSSEAVVYLPESVADCDRRISFVVFRDDRPFLPSPGLQHYSVNSRVLSINIQNLTQFDDGEVIDIHLRPIDEAFQRNQTRSCGYWRFLENGTGMWSQEGCTFIPASSLGLLDTCRCSHLTHFAEVLVPRSVFSEENERALEILSIIGCSLSLFGLFLIALTALVFRSWRRDFNNKIWLNLCVAIFLLIICFLVVVFAKFQDYNILCMLTGISLHYAVICSFCWMLVAAVLSYRRLVLVFTRDASHKLFKACAFAYGLPCAIFGILLSVDPHAYASQFEEKTLSGTFCYPSGLALWMAVYFPVSLILVVNCALFILIVRSIFATKQIQRYGDTNDAIRCASVSFLLVFLFGLPWVFGLFAYSLVFAYLFTLTATFQGFVLCIFFVLGNKKTRDLWMNKLKIRQSNKVPVTSSTSYRRAHTVTIEANSSKPLSLAGTDESRFS